MSKLTVEVDLYTELVPDGIETILYIGEADEAALVNTKSFVEIIDEFISGHMIFGTLALSSRDDVANMVDGFKKAAVYAVKAARKAGHTL